MSYLNLPKNRLIVNGVDLSEKFKMVLVDGYALDPPSLKTYTVKVPGGNGKLDLTESLIGDATYENRKQTFTFYVIDTKDFEKVKTEVSRFLHGKAFNYVMTMDPEFTYHGRFTISKYSHKAYVNGIVGTITINVEADPYKLKETQILKIDGVGGVTLYLPSGRMRVRPIIETDGLTKVIYDNKLVTLQQGAWTINALLFAEGDNEVYVNTFDVRNLTWGDIKNNGITWGGFKAMRLYEWYKSNGDGTYVIKTWEQLTERTWESMANETWADQLYMSDITSVIKNTYIKYDWGDL